MFAAVVVAVQQSQPMRHSLRAHMIYLENTITSVQNRLAKRGLSIDEVQDLQLQLTLAESALNHYHKAYELEQSVAGPEPPAGADADSKDSAGNAKNRNGEKKKEGLSGVPNRARKRLVEGFCTARADIHQRWGSLRRGAESLRETADSIFRTPCAPRLLRAGQSSQ